MVKCVYVCMCVLQGRGREEGRPGEGGGEGEGRRGSRDIENIPQVPA